MRTLLGRFRILRSMHKGPEVETLLAEDIAGQGRRVVIKASDSKSLHAAARERIIREVEALRPIQDESLAPNTLFAEEGGIACVVRAFVAGISLADRLQRGPLTARQAVAVACSLMNALCAAHDRSVLHLNINPHNVILDEETAVAHATLVDFSIRYPQPSESINLDEPAQRVRYLAPEMLGLIEREVVESADLYSAGIVLYECLAGRPPYQGTVAEVLRQHLSAGPPRLRKLGLAVPRALETVIERLLRKDPGDRYQSAAGVLADLQIIADALDRGIASPVLVAGTRDRRRIFAEPSFVGRTNELDVLEVAVNRAADGQGELVYLESLSGGGKTRLLNEFSRRAVEDGAWVLQGQGLDQSVQAPLQILSGVVSGIVAACKDRPQLAVDLRDRLGLQCEAVCSALRDLAPLLAPEMPAVTIEPEAWGELRTVRAVAALFDALGSAHAPAIVLLDDWQWGDDLSLKVLRHWGSRPEVEATGPRHTTVVAAFRSEEVSPGDVLRSIAHSASLILEPLGGNEIRSLMESMAGPVPAEVVDTVAKLSGGNPFLAAAVLHGMVEAGAIVAGPAGWAVGPRALAKVQASREAAEYLTQRLRRFPADLLRLLMGAAVLGREFEIEIAASLAGMSLQEAELHLGEAHRRHLIWSRNHGRYEFLHDKVRESVLDLPSEDERRRLHRRAGELIEARNGSRVFQLAYHYDAAAEPERAAFYALSAAEQSRARHALEDAERQYRIAERGARQADTATRLRIYLGLADVLTLRGGYEETRRWYGQARSLTSDPLMQARIESKLAEVSFKSSDYDTALQACNSGLRLLGRKVPERSPVFFLAFSWALVVHVLHALFPRRLTERRALGTREAEADLLAITLYDRLSFLWYFARSGRTPAAWACLRALNLIELYPPTFERAHGYAALSNVLAAAFPPLVWWSVKLREKAWKTQESVGTLYVRARVTAYRWPVSYVLGDYDAGIRQAREGLQLLALTGDQWDVNASYWGLALCHYSQGRLAEAVDSCRTLYRKAKAIGDQQGVGNALWIWAQAAGGQAPGALIDEALAGPNLFLATRLSLLGAKGVYLIGDGRPEAALEPLEEACRLAIRNGLVDSMIGDVLSWHATALRLTAARTDPAAVHEREDLLRRAHVRARQARIRARIYPMLRTFALREAGRIAAARGRPRAARKLLDAAVTAAEDRGLALQRGLALRARAETGRALGWQDAGVEHEIADRTLRDLGVSPAFLESPPAPEVRPVTLALIERFATLLEKGRSVVTALSKDTAVAAIRDAALTILRAERCVVLDVVHDGDVAAVHPIDAGEGDFSPVLAERAVTTGRPAVYGAEGLGTIEERLSRAGVKSALCAPIFVRGNTISCIYAEHRQVAGLFGEQEARLAQFIATLAGAALENALGVAELESVHQSMRDELERLVSERTAELEHINEELEAFSYSVSHDLRAPLRSIDGFSQALLEDYGNKLEPEAQEYLQRVRRAAQRMGELIDDLLKLSRVARAVLQYENVDLSQLAQEVIEELQRAPPERQVRVIIREGLHAFGDRRLLRIVLENLLGNAWKFTGRTEAARMEFRSMRQNGELVFLVRDNGAGFDPAYADRLFGPFQRLHDASEFPGTGIGLATVQRIIRRHGGRTWAEGEVGKGATFYFSLGGHNERKNHPAR